MHDKFNLLNINVKTRAVGNATGVKESRGRCGTDVTFLILLWKACLLAAKDTARGIYLGTHCPLGKPSH